MSDAVVAFAMDGPDAELLGDRLVAALSWMVDGRRAPLRAYRHISGLVVGEAARCRSPVTRALVWAAAGRVAYAEHQDPHLTGGGQLWAMTAPSPYASVAAEAIALLRAPDAVAPAVRLGALGALARLPHPGDYQALARAGLVRALAGAASHTRLADVVYGRGDLYVCFFVFGGGERGKKGEEIGKGGGSKGMFVVRVNQSHHCSSIFF